MESGTIGDAYVRVNTHLTSSHRDAVANIRNAKHPFETDEGKYLRYILTHNYGWSAINNEYANDSWVHYLQNLFPHIEGLTPILDWLTWLEELEHLPKG